jgi:hypothetical protein
MDDMQNESTPLSELLGDEIYTSEMQGLEGLGEPVTAASIAAATGAVATIAGLIKKIGDLFPKGHKNNEEGKEEGSPTEKVDVDDSGATNPDTNFQSALVKSPSATDQTADKTTDSNEGNFWDKNKTWLKPTAIGVGILAAAYIAFKMIPKKANEHGQPAVSGMEGVKKKRRNKGGGNKKVPIALM